jgi:cytochrome P450
VPAPAIGVALTYVDRRVNAFVPLPVGVPTPAARQFRRARATLGGAVQHIVRARRQRIDPDAGDLLSLLLDARDPESGEALSDGEIRDQVLTFVLAGHETTALTLTPRIMGGALTPSEAQKAMSESTARAC